MLVISIPKKQKRPDLKAISVRGTKILTETAESARLSAEHAELRANYRAAQSSIQDKLFESLVTYLPVL